jgi:hypothetical protein
MKTRNPARGGASRDAALGMAADSGADSTTIETALSYIPAHDRDTWVHRGMAVKACSVCGIPTQGDLCRTCHAWGLLEKHIELATRQLREV